MPLLAVQRHPISSCAFRSVSGSWVGAGAFALGGSFAPSFLGIPAFTFASLLASLLVSFLVIAQPADAAIVIDGFDLTVAPNNTVTVTSSGSAQYFGSVGTAGDYGFVNGWGISSGQITWTDTNADVAAILNATGMHVPVSGRIANSSGSISGSVVLVVPANFGSFYRGLFPAGQPTNYEVTIASGGIGFQVRGTVTFVTSEATLIDAMDLTVDRFANTVTVNYGGSPRAFGAAGDAGLFSLVNGWKVVSGSLTWRNTMSSTVATLYAPGLNVPTGGLSADSSNIIGSAELGGTSTLATVLANQYGNGTSAFKSFAVSSPSTIFYLEGVVTVPEPGATMLGTVAVAAVLVLRGWGEVRKRGGV